MRKAAVSGLALASLAGAAWALDAQQLADIQAAMIGCVDMQQAANDLLNSEEPLPPEAIPAVQALQAGAQQVQMQLVLIQAGG